MRIPSTGLAELGNMAVETNLSTFSRETLQKHFLASKNRDFLPKHMIPTRLNKETSTLSHQALRYVTRPQTNENSHKVKSTSQFIDLILQHSDGA